MTLVSIGMPLYNAERYLSEAIDSVLNQTISDFELVISDNGSRDATANICREYAEKDKRIKLHFHDSNRGAAWNYNHVFELAEGEFFKWLAYDDLIAPLFLEKCLDVLQKTPQACLCFSWSMMIDEHGAEMQPHSDELQLDMPDRVERFRRCLFRKRGKINATLGLVRRSALEKTACIGNYNSSDEILLMNLALIGEFRELSELLMFRRDHPKSSIRSNPTAKDVAYWFDPSKKKIVVLPKLRLVYETFKCVANFGLLWPERITCMKLISQELWWRRELVLRDIKSAMHS